MTQPDRVASSVERAKIACSQLAAIAWLNLAQARQWMGGWMLKHGLHAALVAALTLCALSATLVADVQATIDACTLSDTLVEPMRTLLQGLGAALVGATAIVTSLVLFAMQVNVERMPHGLFRRLSADFALLGAFVLAFVLAIIVAGLSLLVAKKSLAIVSIAAFWSIIFVLLLFMYAYKRALLLVNPVSQLNILLEDTRSEMRTWAKRARRVAPLLRDGVGAGLAPQVSTNAVDVARAAYFNLNPNWTNNLLRATRHAMSFARRYAESGDHEIAGAALGTVTKINALYIDAKGKTFFANNGFIDNPLATDGVVNDTLEHLRQYSNAAIARRDEQQVEQSLQTMASLVEVYLGIDYANHLAPREHAMLAAGYLESAVQTVIPHGMADVLMEGLRLMGRSAQQLLVKSGPDQIVSLTEKIGMIAGAGALRTDYRPVTMEAMRQLATLTFDLLRAGPRRDIDFAAGRLRRDVAFAANLFLKVPDSALSNAHSSYLGPYYSSTDPLALRGRLTGLCNALLAAKPDDEAAQSVLEHIETWADGLYESETELLLEAIKSRSQFTFDMLHWIVWMTEFLLAVSNSPACDDRLQADLRKHASWMISTLTSIPKDKETLTFVARFGITNLLFESVADALGRDCLEVARDIEDVLAWWTFAGGSVETGWGTLEAGLLALAVLFTGAKVDETARLKAKLAEFLAGPSVPSKELRDRAAAELVERAGSLPGDGLFVSPVERAITRVDRGRLRLLLLDLAKLLAPEVA